MFYSFFFFNDTATTEIYTLSLHDALPISRVGDGTVCEFFLDRRTRGREDHPRGGDADRSEEHTSELQSRQYLVCRLLLEKKKKKKKEYISDVLGILTSISCKQLAIDRYCC